MTNDRPDELEDRLRARYAIDDVPDATRTRHLAAIDAALAPRGTALRRRVAAAAAIGIAFTPVGVAVAAEGAVPGDLLYPVKRAVEPVRSVWDDDVAAEHRVKELDVLAGDESATPEILVDAADEADRAVADHPDAVQLQVQLARALDRAAARLEALRQHGGEVEEARRRIEALAQRGREQLQEVERQQDGSDLPTRDEATMSPSRSPAPSPTDGSPGTTDGRGATASDEPRPTPSPSPSVRQERIQTDAGTVTVTIDGARVRVRATDPASGWEAEVDRSDEPERIRIWFRDGRGREVRVEARVGDDGDLEVRIEQHERNREGPAGSTDSGDGSGGGRTG